MPSRVAAPSSSLYSFTASPKLVPFSSLARASCARRHASSRVRVIVAGARLEPDHFTSRCFTVTFSGSSLLFSRFASAVARHFPAGVSAAPAFSCVFAGGDEPPHAMADNKRRARAPRNMAGIIFRVAARVDTNGTAPNGTFNG